MHFSTTPLSAPSQPHRPNKFRNSLHPPNILWEWGSITSCFQTIALPSGYKNPGGFKELHWRGGSYPPGRFPICTCNGIEVGEGVLKKKRKRGEKRNRTQRRHPHMHRMFEKLLPCYQSSQVLAFVAVAVAK